MSVLLATSLAVLLLAASDASALRVRGDYPIRDLLINRPAVQPRDRYAAIDNLPHDDDELYHLFPLNARTVRRPGAPPPFFPAFDEDELDASRRGGNTRRNDRNQDELYLPQPWPIRLPSPNRPVTTYYDEDELYLPQPRPIRLPKPIGPRPNRPVATYYDEDELYLPRPRFPTDKPFPIGKPGTWPKFPRQPIALPYNPVARKTSAEVAHDDDEWAHSGYPLPFSRRSLEVTRDDDEIWNFQRMKFPKIPYVTHDDDVDEDELIIQKPGRPNLPFPIYTTYDDDFEAVFDEDERYAPEVAAFDDDERYGGVATEIAFDEDELHGRFHPDDDEIYFPHLYDDDVEAVFDQKYYEDQDFAPFPEDFDPIYDVASIKFEDDEIQG